LGSSELAAGPAVVHTIELSARLTILTARTAGRADLAQRARSIAERVGPLAAEDAAAYRDYLATRSEESQRRTVELPVQMAELAAEAAEVAAAAARATDGAVGGDAKVGVLLAECAARAAALLVELNGGGDAAASATARASLAASLV